jgi:hypothetical protein
MTLLLKLIRGKLFRWVHSCVLNVFGFAFALCGTVAVSFFFNQSGHSILVAMAWAVAAMVLCQVGIQLHVWFLEHQEIEPGLWAIPHKPRQLSIYPHLRFHPKLQQRYNQGERWWWGGERLEIQHELVLHLLTRKVGNLSPAIFQKVQRLTLPQIDALGEALVNFEGLSDLQAWLEHQNQL